MGGARSDCSSGTPRHAFGAIDLPARGSRRSTGGRANTWRWRGRARIRRYLVDRLERLTGECHQLIYQQRELGLKRLRRILRRISRPRCARTRATSRRRRCCSCCRRLVLGLLVYARPELILSVVDAETAAEFEEMYSPIGRFDRPLSHGRHRLDDVRLLHPQQHRRRVPVLRRRPVRGPRHRCSSWPTTARSAARLPAISTERGLSTTFYSFVATHSAFELTAIVLSGAAGLRIGHALLAPGRQTRVQSLVLGVARVGSAALRRHRHAAHRRGGRSVLVVGELAAATGEVRRRRAVLDRRPRLFHLPGAPCRLTRWRCGCGRARRMEAADLGVRLCQSAAPSVYPCYLVAVCRCWRSRWRRPS